MNGQGRWLQWTYPMFLWFLVAVFTVLACKNVVSTAWSPAQPRLIHSLYAPVEAFASESDYRSHASGLVVAVTPLQIFNGN